jgi:hypothetical protein
MVAGCPVQKRSARPRRYRPIRTVSAQPISTRDRRARGQIQPLADRLHKQSSAFVAAILPYRVSTSGNGRGPRYSGRDRTAADLRGRSKSRFCRFSDPRWPERFLSAKPTTGRWLLACLLIPDHSLVGLPCHSSFRLFNKYKEVACASTAGCACRNFWTF